jgi:hypothetical protein
VIFAAPGPSTSISNHNYLAMVFHVVLTLTPTLAFVVSTPTLPPPSYTNCQTDPNPSAAPNYPVRITNIN